jgi:superfamily I DNA/RNA helicase
MKIFGAPGCGKTTRVMDVLTTELATVAPERIAFVSFTRKGTYEGVERAMSIHGLREEQLPYFKTLHSIAFRHGGYTKYDMISKHDYKTFSDSMGMRFTGYYTEDFYNNDDKYLFAHFLKRNNPRAGEVLADSLRASVLRDVETNFARYKSFAKVHDFTDLIERFVEVGEPLPVDVAIIDEAQDLTSLQWKMCEIAFANCQRLYVAGDDDQAIYEWSGADVEYFLHMRADETEVLGKSYRLPSNILDVASSVSRQISRRVEKRFDPVSNGGEVTFYNSIEDVPLTSGETWYFLCRNNWFLQYYRDWLKKKARVFMDKTTASYSPREFEAIRAYESARRRGRATELEEIRIKQFMKPDAPKTVPWYEAMNLHNDVIAYYRDLIKYKTDLKDQTLQVNTIHGVKGGEADNVVLMLDFTRAVRDTMERSPDTELRCLYVALTRAKKHLHVVHSGSKNGYDDYIRSREVG